MTTVDRRSSKTTESLRNDTPWSLKLCAGLGLQLAHGSLDAQVVWFKRDLRVRDHEPLTYAAQRGPVLPIYIAEPVLWQQPDAAAQHADVAAQHADVSFVPWPS